MSDMNKRLNAAEGVNSRWRQLVKSIAEAAPPERSQRYEELRGQEKETKTHPDGGFVGRYTSEKRERMIASGTQELTPEQAVPPENKWRSLVAQDQAKESGAKMR